MTANSLFPDPTGSSDSQDTSTIVGDTLTAQDREHLAALLSRAARVVFPEEDSSLPNTRLGDTSQQDYYFRILLRTLLENASSHGCPAVAAHLDDLWAFLGEQFRDWARRHKGARQLSRESVRQLTSFQWRRAFATSTREARVDARAFDDEPPYDVHVQFNYTAASEHAPLLLSAQVNGFRPHGGSPGTLSVTAIAPSCWLRPIEDYQLPDDHERATAFVGVLAHAVKRYIPKNETALKNALSRVQKRDNREDAFVLQSALRLLHSGADGDETHTSVLRSLRDAFVDKKQEAARKEARDIIDDVIDTVSTEERDTFLAAVRMLARGAMRAAAAAILLVVLTYFVPTPVQAKVRAIVRRVFDYIVTRNITDDFESGRVTIDPNRAVFVLADGRETMELREPTGPGLLLVPANDPRQPFASRGFRMIDHPNLPVHWLGGVGTDRTGIAVGVYRPTAATIEPWFIMLAVIPQQDEQLASEVAIGTTTFSLAVSPALPDLRWHGQQYIGYGGTERIYQYMFAELPHIARTYTFIAKIHRPSGDQYESAQVSFSATGVPTLIATTSREPLRVVKKLEWKMHSCATSLLLGHNGGLRVREDANVWLWATAVAHEEQTVTFTIAPPKTAFAGGKVAIYYGDGTGEQREYVPFAQFTHRYRVGERRYPVVVFFENSSYEYSREVYVFSDRPRTGGGPVLTYEAPYPPRRSVARLEWQKYSVPHIGGLVKGLAPFRIGSLQSDTPFIPSRLQQTELRRQGLLEMLSYGVTASYCSRSVDSNAHVQSTSSETPNRCQSLWHTRGCIARRTAQDACRSYSGRTAMPK